jgi:ribose transport system ATP-binding protein
VSIATAQKVAVAGLTAERVSKRFGGQLALDAVTLTIAPSSIHGLLGENGSGKSTLIKILSGLYSPDSGNLTVAGRELSLPLGPGVAAANGIRFVHQDLGLIPTLTVAENFGLDGLAENRTGWRTSQRRLSHSAAGAFRRFEVEIDPSVKVSSLTALEQALVAIVRAVDALPLDGGVLVLDEPTVYLPRRDVTRLFDLLRRLRDDGHSILLVSHDLEEIIEVTDHVTVLRNGRNAGSRPTAGVSVGELVSMIVGRDLAAEYAEHRDEDVVAGEPLLRVRGLCGQLATDIDLDVAPGEIIGLAGVGGSGFEEIPYLLAGARRAKAGEVWLEGRRIDFKRLSPAGAVAAGMTLLPADRRRLGGLLTLSVTDNITQPRLAGFTRSGLLSRGAMRRDAESLMERFDIRPRGAERRLGDLSGGNQQKTLLAKWLATEPKLLLVHEPTQGVDIGARQQIFAVLREAAAAGRSVVCASSDFGQLATLTSRTCVFRRGRLVATLSGEELTKNNITAACLEA